MVDLRPDLTRKFFIAKWAKLSEGEKYEYFKYLQASILDDMTIEEIIEEYKEYTGETITEADFI